MLNRELRAGDSPGSELRPQLQPVTALLTLRLDVSRPNPEVFLALWNSQWNVLGVSPAWAGSVGRGSVLSLGPPWSRGLEKARAATRVSPQPGRDEGPSGSGDVPRRLGGCPLAAAPGTPRVAGAGVWLLICFSSYVFILAF